MVSGVCSSINLRETVRKGPCQALLAGEWLLWGKGRQLKMKLDPAHEVRAQGTLSSLRQALGGRAVRRYQHAEAEAQPSAGVSGCQVDRKDPVAHCLQWVQISHQPSPWDREASRKLLG